MPPDDELFQLARTYLETQRSLWTELSKKGILPEVTDTVLIEMVNGYKQRHRTGVIEVSESSSVFNLLSMLTLALFYGRYSCDNSSPTSIIDQLFNSLKKAKEEDRFIPWEFVFADYSVSGLDSSRQAYGNAKSLIREHGNTFDSIYIDDFSRASRDALEWWRLAALCKNASKRMIGASDGFDLSSPQWDVWITIYGLLSRLFISGLRQKVLRGMRGAARRFTVLGKQPIGYTRKRVRDKNGEIVRRANEKPLYEPAIDANSAELVRRIFLLYTEKRWSPYKIARQFNKEKCDDTDTWTESTIKKILKNPVYIGVFIWNKTKRDFDHETEKWVIIRNPRSEWNVRYMPQLGIITMDSWRNAQRITSENKLGKRCAGALSRNQRSATTLFSGTLHCGYCGKELTLGRSAGKYKNMFCSNGRVEVSGCQLSTTKSTRIIEECILSYLLNELLSTRRMDDLFKSLFKAGSNGWG